MPYVSYVTVSCDEINVGKIDVELERAKAEGAAWEERHKTPVTLKAVYEPKGEALEYAGLGLNLYGGCSHKCAYCYNEGMFDGLCTDPVKKSTLEHIEHDLRDLAGEKTPVHLCFVGDPYDLGREDNGYVRKVLELFRKYDHPFQVLTKGGTRAVKDFDLYGPRDAFGVTLTLENDVDSLKWEPGAALPADRIEALKQAHDRGIPTWASLEPVIDPAQTLHLIDLTHDFVDHYGVGKLNTRGKKGISQELKDLEKSIDWCKYRSDVEAKLKGYAKQYKIKQALLDAIKCDEPKLIACVVCGENLIVGGKVLKGHTMKNGKFYCARPGCGYPAREKDLEVKA